MLHYNCSGSNATTIGRVDKGLPRRCMLNTHLVCSAVPILTPVVYGEKLVLACQVQLISGTTTAARAISILKTGKT